MTDIVTYCDVNTCEDCPRYGDDCDGDKRVERTDLISRADAIEALSRSSIYAWSTEQDLVAHSWAIRILQSLPSAEAVQGGRYENAMQKLREMQRYLNCVKAKQITKISADDVVRCKDCRKGIRKTTDEDELVFCQVFQKWFAETFFCAEGERREP